jgi:hypothetical protein
LISSSILQTNPPNIVSHRNTIPAYTTTTTA